MGRNAMKSLDINSKEAHTEPMNTDTMYLATRDNMREFPGHIAFSFTTGEEYSGTPGDHFLMGEHEPLLDDLGNPMVLVRRVTFLVPAGEADPR
jgi:hypothetical protein